jgi:hypothetical protein
MAPERYVEIVTAAMLATLAAPIDVAETRL